MLRNLLAPTSIAAAILLSACGGGSTNEPVDAVAEQTPSRIQMNFLGRYESGVFGESAAEIPAVDIVSKRGFVVNSEKGALDVLDLSVPASPKLLSTLRVSDINGIPANAVVNSVASKNGLVAIAIESNPKTDPGFVALYRASDLALLDFIEVGAQPDMLVFTPNGSQLLVANEGEPADDYATDPEGSVSVIDVSLPSKLSLRTASFRAFNDQVQLLRQQGVRIFGRNATVAQDLEPEYIAVSPDSKTAYVSLQENNAMAVIDLATARVSKVLPFGYKDHGVMGNGFAANDKDTGVSIALHPGVLGMYQPDAIAVHQFNGVDYVVTANEGDAREWGDFVEEMRVGDLFASKGFKGPSIDLASLAGGAILNPATFSYCGASLTSAGNCLANDVLGRLNVTWTQGYQRNSDGSPKLYTQLGELADANTAKADARLMYDNVYSFGARSMSVFSGNTGALVWDSGDFIEQYTGGDLCKAGVLRDTLCKSFFNSGHDKVALNDRSDNKGPEPEGIVLGQIGIKTFAFLGLERVGGVMAFDISDPRNPVFQDYLNTRDFSVAKPAAASGDLGAEGLAFVPSALSPTGKPLLITGHEVSGTTSVYEVVGK
ncbi:choice-of-anchor I family protein [Paraperlucidibaca wandonensis]|uniref:Choice-of-anchor I family protein n=1 Tax=Paraperlucidibaca wandonensis TaxID=1268273 RepID=A0ABW3HC18_9GAMM